LVETLGRFGGGFVAGYYGGGNEVLGLTAEPQDIACKTFVEFGTFS